MAESAKLKWREVCFDQSRISFYTTPETFIAVDLMIFGCLILISNVIYLVIIHTSYLNSVLYAVSCKTPFTSSQASEFRVFLPSPQTPAQPRTTILSHCYICEVSDQSTAFNKVLTG